MAGARAKLSGELVAWLIRNIPAAVWAPDKLPSGDELNPFGRDEPESEAMRAHKAAWARAKFRAAVTGAGDGE